MRSLCLSVLLSLLPRALPAAQDPCEAAIPAPVAAATKKAFPRYLLPMTSHSAPEAVAFQRSTGGSGCNSVAQADFNGDGTPDYALILTPRGRARPLLVVALSSGTSYSASRLRSFEPLSRSALYVDPLKPGHFVRTDAADSDDLEPGERRALRSKRPGIAAGVFESWEVGYFLTSRGWRWVRLAD